MKQPRDVINGVDDNARELSPYLETTAPSSRIQSITTSPISSNAASPNILQLISPLVTPPVLPQNEHQTHHIPHRTYQNLDKENYYNISPNEIQCLGKSGVVDDEDQWLDNLPLDCRSGRELGMSTSQQADHESDQEHSILDDSLVYNRIARNDRETYLHFSPRVDYRHHHIGLSDCWTRRTCENDQESDDASLHGSAHSSAHTVPYRVCGVVLSDSNTIVSSNIEKSCFEYSESQFSKTASNRHPEHSDMHDTIQNNITNKIYQGKSNRITPTNNRIKRDSNKELHSRNSAFRQNCWQNCILSPEKVSSWTWKTRNNESYESDECSSTQNTFTATDWPSDHDYNFVFNDQRDYPNDEPSTSINAYKSRALTEIDDQFDQHEKNGFLRFLAEQVIRELYDQIKQPLESCNICEISTIKVAMADALKFQLLVLLQRRRHVKTQGSAFPRVGGPNFAAPSVLAHPDEFKNPSSFLKIYGDPMCVTGAGAKTPLFGINGNWICQRCECINFPRRFRCNKCERCRDASGDAIVRGYARRVYRHHAKLYRSLTPKSSGSK